MTIALVGVTGNVAGRALETLLQAKAPVTVLVRHPEKLPASLRSKASPEAQIEQGDLDDASFVVRATRGADALLWLTPSTFAAADFRAYTLALAQNAARAVRENEIPRVVFVSSHGADRPGSGHVSFAGEVEKVLEAAAPHTVSLRSAGFMENLFTSVEALRSGQLFGVLPRAKKYPLVATRDLGDAAAGWLLDPSWRGHQVRGVHGPEDLSVDDQVAILSRVLGKTIQYRQIPPAALRDTFLKRGASPSVAEAYFEMFNAFAREDYQPTEKRTAETTTSTTFETFVREALAPRVRAV